MFLFACPLQTEIKLHVSELKFFCVLHLHYELCEIYKVTTEKQRCLALTKSVVWVESTSSIKVSTVKNKYFDQQK